jgi:hypothetical protein
LSFEIERMAMNRRRWLEIIAVLVTAAAITGVFYKQINQAPSRPTRPTSTVPPSVALLPTSQSGILGSISIKALSINAQVISESIVGQNLQLPAGVNQIGLWDDGGSIDGTNGTVLLVGSAAPGYCLAALANITQGTSITTSGGQVWSVSSVVTSTSLPHYALDPVGARRLILVGVMKSEKLIVVSASPD